LTRHGPAKAFGLGGLGTPSAVCHALDMTDFVTAAYGKHVERA
jgi:hypothetical protein